MRLDSAGSTFLQHHKMSPSIDAPIPSKTIITDWKGSALHKESTLHQLSPYIGKIKSSMAQTLITKFTCENQTIYDPYSGSGTIAFEAWAAGRKVIANDLSPYAFVLTRAKL